MAETRGIILRDEGDTLIVQASEADVQRFTSGDAVGLRRVDGLAVQAVSVAEIVDAIMELKNGEWLFDAQGRPVAQVSNVAVDGYSEGRPDPYHLRHLVRGSFDPRQFPNPYTDRVPVGNAQSPFLPPRGVWR